MTNMSAPRSSADLCGPVRRHDRRHVHRLRDRHLLGLRLFDMTFTAAAVEAAAVASTVLSWHSSSW
eukprot:CAMPEP_0181209780 /NCGR_PEP_ID=MMETSP1096-20121128/22857_1 /TAXON_ID=156174 ORGANISM="Chrysochromulina ericina, Strain CCMP281" /NCGR_SAMPLE_ID=MMETSP1096 /ASSEMBLY_ACC=CAM_ASM_000453 /LENGTH=65 /DNA_ID=CAMNT_0023300981 /DNA_START=199 /DNA_END=393 /DNA_ORIENTATION=+